MVHPFVFCPRKSSTISLSMYGTPHVKVCVRILKTCTSSILHICFSVILKPSTLVMFFPCQNSLDMKPNYQQGRLTQSSLCGIGWAVDIKSPPAPWGMYSAPVGPEMPGQTHKSAPYSPGRDCCLLDELFPGHPPPLLLMWMLIL